MPVLEQLTKLGSSGPGTQEPDEALEVIKPLLSVEMITVLQVLGFNFKRAIGEPLTDLVARFISSRAPMDASVQLEVKKITTEREIAFMELARDEAAFRRANGI